MTTKPYETAPGLELCLTLAAEKLQSIEATLDRTRQQFDHDEGDYAYVLEHNPMCPAHRSIVHCACGLTDTHESLRDAVADARDVRESIGRCLASLKATR